MADPQRRLSDETITALAECFATMSPAQLAALPAVHEAALRGGNTAMRAPQREEFELGLAALERILEATRGAR